MFLKKIGYIILLIIVLTSCKDVETKPNSGDEISNDNAIEKNFDLADYIGIWDSEEEDSIEVFKVDDNTLAITYSRVRTGGFTFDNVEFDEKGYGKCKYTNSWVGRDGEKYSQEVEGCVYLGDNTITIKIEKCDVLYFDNSWENTFNIDKGKYCVATEEEINYKIQQAISSEFKNIDNDILNVVKDGEKYITLGVNVNCLIIDTPYRYYSHDSQLYNIDKKAKKIITVYDFLDNNDRKLEAVKNYINQEILRKTQEYVEQYNEDDLEPHWCFDEYYFEEQFTVNEENKSLDIKCSYPSEALRCYGDLTIEVPFDVFDKVE